MNKIFDVNGFLKYKGHAEKTKFLYLFARTGLFTIFIESRCIGTIKDPEIGRFD